MGFFISSKNKKKLEVLFKNEKRILQNILLTGEEAIGKTSSALYLSKTLLCLKRNKDNPCGVCESCLEFEKKCHPDFLMIFPNDEVISINDIKNLINFLSFKPRISELKIGIIDEAQVMTKEAQNALLKTLEEPHLDNLLILVSSYPEKLLPTIRSRVMKINLLPASKEEIKDYLSKEYFLEEERAKEIAEKSNGKIAEAMRMLDPQYLKIKKEAKEILKKLILGTEIERFSIIEKLQEQDLFFYLKEWLIELRKNKDFVSEKKRIFLMKKLLQGYLIMTNQNINQKLLLNNIFLNL